MSTPLRPTDFLLGLAVIAVSVYAYLEHNALLQVRDEADALRKERGSLQARIADLEKTAQTRAAAAAAAASDVTGGPRLQRFPGDGFMGGPMSGFGGPGFGRFASMLDNPEIQKLMSIQQKAGLDARYAALFKMLNLSPADLDKFKNLLVERQTAVMDALSAARAQGLTGPENRSALQQVIADANAEVESNIKAALGDAAYSQYQLFEQTAPERNTVTQLQQRLSYSNAPLTDEQANQVIAIMAANAPERVTATGAPSASGSTGPASPAPAPGGGGFGAFRNGGGQAPITDTVIASAQGVLNDTQIAALTQLQQEQQAQAQLAAQMRAARQAAGSGGPVPTPAPVATAPRP